MSSVSTRVEGQLLITFERYLPLVRTTLRGLGYRVEVDYEYDRDSDDVCGVVMLRVSDKVSDSGRVSDDEHSMLRLLVDRLERLSHI